MATFRFPALFIPLLIISCTTQENPSDQVLSLADSYVAEYYTAYPELAVVWGAPDLYPARLSDNSLDALAEWQSTEDSLFAQLQTIDASALEGSVSVTYGFLHNLLETSINMRSCRMKLWRVSPTYTGWQNELPFVFAALPVETEEQREDAYSRLSQMPDYILTEIDNLETGLASGFAAPGTGVMAVIGQMDALLAAPVEDSPFVSIAPEESGAFRDRVINLIEMEIRPAIAEYRTYLAEEYLPKARAAVGVSNLPNGDECYQASTAYYISAQFSAEEIHQQGLDQLEVIMEQISELGERSLGTGDPDEILRIVKEDPQYRFESREQMIQYAEDAVARAEEALPDWFGFIPPNLETEVIPYPPFQEKTAPLGQAIPPTADGSQPGKYVINTYQPETQTQSMLESLSFHEAYPGHLFQIYVSLAADKHPVSSYFYISGFGEGWALYTERLAEEMDLYTSDVSRIGWLASEAHRAARLVVDSGMHALGWTRQQSIDYLMENTTLTPNLAAAETDRYIAVPGQATSYMMGALEIMALRSEAEESLGDDFDIKEFHDILLEDGTIPLSMMRDKVEAWIEMNS